VLQEQLLTEITELAIAANERMKRIVRQTLVLFCDLTTPAIFPNGVGFL
jgi:hypothetical protein